MLVGIVLLALSVLMLYQGFTGNPAVAEIAKLISGEAAFSTKGRPLAAAIRAAQESSFEDRFGGEIPTIDPGALSPNPPRVGGGSGGGGTVK